jgi:hypothetical protein
MACICLAALIGPAVTAQADPAKGPLRIHPANPRYFTDGTKGPDGSLRAVYLTGAHTWNNLVDMGRSDPPEPFDFPLPGLLERHHHNFIRLGVGFDRLGYAASRAGKDFITSCAATLGANRSRQAHDGKPRFDLTNSSRVFRAAAFARGGGGPAGST